MLDLRGTRRDWIWHSLIAVILFVLALFVISVLTFVLIYLTPGDPAQAYLHASGIHNSPEALKAAREQLGLNKPAIVQYWDWLVQVLHGNLGTSYLLKQPVLKVLGGASLNTFKLGITSLIMLTIVSTLLALWSVKRPNGIVDGIIQAFSLVAVSFPNFFLGYLLIIFFAATLNWFPVSGISGDGAIVLPAVTLMMPYLGQTTLFLRKCFLGHKGEAHTENAVLRGVKYRFIMQNHLLRNASSSFVTIVSINFLNLVTGSIIVEDIFAWPGIGRMFVKAVQNGDTTLIQGSLLLFGFMAITINALTQLGVKWLDPQQRHQNRGDL